MKITKKQAFIEITTIVLWALFLGIALINFDPRMRPMGDEWWATTTFQFWLRVKECGACAFWNGTFMGGFPAFADLYAAVFHPLTALTVSFWGISNGSKIIILVSLISAGIAQWWLGKELEIHPLFRIWGALLAVAGGHLSGRLSVGLVNMTLSTAMGAFFFPVVISIYRKHNYRKAALLAIVFASIILSGQGYIQFATILILPLVLIFIIDTNAPQNINPSWKQYLLGFGLGGLITGPFLLTILTTFSNISKSAFPEIDQTQNLSNSFLNLFINDFQYYNERDLYPALFINFIGWVTVFFAVSSLYAKYKDRKIYAFLALSIVIPFVFLSQNAMKLMFTFSERISQIRYPGLGLGLVIPPLIALACISLDDLWKRKWPKIYFSSQDKKDASSLSIDFKWLLIIPLALNLFNAAKFSKDFYKLQPYRDWIFPVLENLATEDTQWISTPDSSVFYMEPGGTLNYKITTNRLPWELGGRLTPWPPHLIGILNNAEPPAVETEILLTDTVQVGPEETLYVYTVSAGEYAKVINGEEFTACKANANSGIIQVSCPASTPAGRLVLQETMWEGWQAWVDGEQAALVGTEWLEVDLTAGAHEITFEFHPWQVSVGLFLTVLTSLALLGLVFSDQITELVKRTTKPKKK